MRRKKIRTRSLGEAKLEKFCYGFICHPQVVFKFVLYNKSILTHLQLAPSGFKYAILNSGPVSSFEAFFPDSGLVCIIAYTL